MASSTRSADDLIRYVLEPKKNQQGERYVMASGTNGLLVSLAKEQMRDVRERWGKNKPGAVVQAYHVIQSFAKGTELAPDDPSDWMVAQRLGRALAETVFPDRHALVVTQRDGAGGCLHNHLVVASIETKTGRSLDSSVVMHARLVEAHEAVLEREGFEQLDDLKQAFTDATDRRERGESSRLRRATARDQRDLLGFTRHAQWQAECAVADETGGEHRLEPFSLSVLRQRIDQALSAASSIDWPSFVANGKQLGVDVHRANTTPWVSYGMMRSKPDKSLREPAASDRRRCITLGTAYSLSSVNQRVAANAEAAARSVRATRFVLTEQEELEVAARMAPDWLAFFEEREAQRARLISIDLDPRLKMDVTAVSELSFSDRPTATGSEAVRRIEASRRSVELEQIPVTENPAPVSAGAEATPCDKRLDADSMNDSVDPRPASDSIEAAELETSAREAQVRLAAREVVRRRSRVRATLNFDSHDEAVHDVDREPGL
ncbi:relaxase/mobilization nuclease domain-containing protein [Microbacterium sp.]|uniref:relaxase/mobilization nuclease domain-containing protein n=1 Tax=Microbacterium sp. TaxID=51671 RepID=UPI003565EF0E